MAAGGTGVAEDRERATASRAKLRDAALDAGLPAELERSSARPRIAA